MKRKSKKILLILLLCLAAATAACLGTKLYCYYHDYEKDRTHYQELCENVVWVPTDAYTEEKEKRTEKMPSKQVTLGQTELTHPPIEIDWKKLEQINSDIVGWVYFSGLKQISYPVLQADNNSYYVNRTYDCSDDNSKAGSIFMDYRMKADFSSPYTIIYGHNMRDGSMFSDLAKLRKQAVYEENPYFWILTPDNSYEYQIISVFECDRSADVFQTTFDNFDDTFANWEKELISRSIVQPIKVGSNMGQSPIIVFSTCVPNSFNRTIVCGMRIS